MLDSSCFHSTSEAYPWWAVDLGAALSVFGILFTYGVPDHWAKNGVELTIDSGRYSVEAGILEPLSVFGILFTNRGDCCGNVAYRLLTDGHNSYKIGYTECVRNPGVL